MYGDRKFPLYAFLMSIFAFVFYVKLNFENMVSSNFWSLLIIILYLVRWKNHSISDLKIFKL